MKRIFLKLSTMIATVLLMSFIMISVVFALETNGYFTDDRGQRLPCDWSLNTTTGILRITGSGALPDYDSGDCLPFAGGVNGTWIGPYVRIVYVEDGITRIGKYGFTAGSGDLSTPNIHTVYIAASVTQIGKSALARQKINKVVIYGEDVTFESNAITLNATIYGYAGSSVEQFAKENGNEFVPICREHILKTVDSVEPSCLTDGYSGNKVCTVCGLTIEQGEAINALGHDYVTVDEVVPSCTESGYSGDIRCSRCGDVKEKGNELPAKGHAFGGWQVTTMPTCQSLGEKIRFCENCDVYEVADIAMLDHKWNDFYTVDQEALCELEGSESIHCSVCGTKQEGSDQVIQAKGHSLYVAESYSKNATCTEGGLTVYFCKNCEYALEETIAPLGHDWDADGKCIRCGESKYYQDGWVTIKGEKYFYENGTPRTGWLLYEDNWYYLDPYYGGRMHKGPYVASLIGGKWYYFNEYGMMQANSWIIIDGFWCYATSSGALQTGWGLIDGKWHIMDSRGYTYTGGWIKDGGKWYYLDPSERGAMVTGWLKDNGTWYYLNSSGAMVTGWQKVNGTWYFFKSSGAMAANEWCGGYWLNANGSWTYQPVGSWKRNSTGWWFGDTSGWYAKNETLKINDVFYTFNAAGYWVE